MQMKDGKHRGEFFAHGEELTVREIANERPPSTLLDLWKLQGILDESCENRLDFSFESKAKAGALALISKRCFEHLKLGLERDVEPPHSASGAQTGEKLFADLWPGARARLATTVCGEAFGNDLPVPVWHGHLLGVLREMSPQRLNVFEFLIR